MGQRRKTTANCNHWSKKSR